MIEIRVYALPATQGSKKFVGMRAGRGILVNDNKRCKPWREAIVAAAMEVVPEGSKMMGPIVADITFTLPKPKSAPKNRRTWPDKKPDLSKLIRSTEDALTDAGVWEDDARVIDIKARKVFPGEHSKSLHVPGAVIQIWTVSAD